jgi:protease PrsW
MAPETAPALPSDFFFICVAGPDRGKRLSLAATDMLIGKGATANLLSDDPDVTDRFAELHFDGTRLHITALGTPLPFIDGHAVATAVLTGGQQVRLGRSLWEVHAPGAELSAMGLINRLGDHLSSAAGIEKPGEWDGRAMFSDAGKMHRDEEVETFFTVGTQATTPPLAAIDAQWPKPWVFARVFGMTLLMYLGFVFGWKVFNNENLIPGLIMIGAVAVPLSLLVFFLEVNVPRNISLYQVIKLLLVGGLASIVISLFFFQWTGLENVLGAASAGIIEESGKALALLLVVNKPRYRWTLNGLLLGATVGTGFAVFESAGYAMRAAFEGGGDVAMFDSITQRGFLSVLGGHVLWTGLVGAALWRVRGDRPFRLDMLTDTRFLRVIGICMAMHMIWNWSGIDLPLYGKNVLLGAAAWLLVLGTIQGGLKQVREAQTV